MRTVWKYELPHDATLKIYGTDPRVVHVAVDPAGHYSNQPSVWVELEPNVTPADGHLELCFFGTGFDIPEGLAHVGSCITPHGFVWHVYRAVTAVTPCRIPSDMALTAGCPTCGHVLGVHIHPEAICSICQELGR